MSQNWHNNELRTRRLVLLWRWNILLWAWYIADVCVCPRMDASWMKDVDGKVKLQFLIGSITVLWCEPHSTGSVQSLYCWPWWTLHTTTEHLGANASAVELRGSSENCFRFSLNEKIFLLCGVICLKHVNCGKEVLQIRIMVFWIVTPSNLVVESLIYHM
jgi:hypothetical protein